MSSDFTATEPLPDFPLWDRLSHRRVPLSFELEVTARCNCDCCHCYINLPAGDRVARGRELSLAEIDDLASQAVELGALWCLVTGGEPLLRRDFFDLYRLLKRKGLLVSLFTNACLVAPEHVRFLQDYPPRDLEISVYGVTRETYERVTRRPGSYAAFRRGLDLLLEAGIPVRLKAMALRSNVHELPEIAAFCRTRTKDYFRFDPLLHLRYDRDPLRNAEIKAERLSPAEIAAVEQADPERAASLQKNCGDLVRLETGRPDTDTIFSCGAGLASFSVTYDGYFRLCSSLNHASSLYDLRQARGQEGMRPGALRQAWFEFVPQVRDLRSSSPEFIHGCATCPLVNLCLWCPANADLELGRLDGRTDYFCQVAGSRAQAIQTAHAP
jgi:radical SAM protein with 4Fe4S-binding SPASM domain